MLRREGYSAAIAKFNGPDDTGAVIARAIAEKPRLIGLSVIFQFSAGDFLGLARQLRDAGSDAKIVIGGHFPSFEYEPLLLHHPAIDIVVRFEGEQTILDLLRALDSPATWSQIPGLAFRQDGSVHATPPCPLVADLDALPFPVRDGEIKRHRGVGDAALLGSRGCYHRCSFCSIGAFYHQPNGRPQRMRSVRNVVDEMELLQREYGVGLFIFNDDEFFDLADPRRPLAFADELESRGLKGKMFIKCRASDVDEPVFSRLKEVGLIRAYVGIETGAQPALEVFNKRLTVEQNRRAVTTLKKLDILADFKLLLFNPYTTLMDIEDNLRFIDDLAADGCVPITVARMEVYSGTPIMERLRAEGRLRGDYVAWDYEIEDPAAELVFRQMLAAMYRRNYDLEGLSKTAIQAYYDLLIYKHFYPKKYEPGIEDALRRIVAKLNRHTVGVIRRLLAYARTEDLCDVARVNKLTIELALETNRVDMELGERLRRWRLRLNRLVENAR